MMKKVFIEEYRGFVIEFSPDNEAFQCIISDGNEKESKSFAAVKRFIDDYKKDNQSFSPFMVEANPANPPYGKVKRLKIVGIRKDKRFIAEEPDGKKIQVSDYDASRWMIVLEWNKAPIEELAEIEAHWDEAQELYREERKRVIDSMNIVDLKDKKEELLKNE